MSILVKPFKLRQKKKRTTFFCTYWLPSPSKTFSSSWSCRFINVFQCSKSSVSDFWMSLSVPSLWMLPSFIAIIWKVRNTSAEINSQVCLFILKLCVCALTGFSLFLNKSYFHKQICLLKRQQHYLLVPSPSFKMPKTQKLPALHVFRKGCF